MKNINVNMNFFEEHANANMSVNKISPIVLESLTHSIGASALTGVLAYPFIVLDLYSKEISETTEVPFVMAGITGLTALTAAIIDSILNRLENKKIKTISNNALSKLNEFAVSLKKDGIETTGEMLKDGEIIIDKSWEDKDSLSFSSSLVTEKILAFKNIRNEINLLREISNRDSKGIMKELQVLDTEEATDYMTDSRLRKSI